MTGPETLTVDRFAVANAAFWLDQVAAWLADPGHADQFAGDLWGNHADTGPALTVIVARAAAALRTTLTESPNEGTS